MFKRTQVASKHEDCYGDFKKIVRNCDFQKSDNFKKLSVLAQILGFSYKIAAGQMKIISS